MSQFENREETTSHYAKKPSNQISKNKWFWLYGALAILLFFLLFKEHGIKYAFYYLLNLGGFLYMVVFYYDLFQFLKTRKSEKIKLTVHVAIFLLLTITVILLLNWNQIFQIYSLSLAAAILGFILQPFFKWVKNLKR